MSSIVTRRFIECHQQLLSDGIVRSSRQFALSLEYLPQSLSEILKGRRDVTIELIRKAVDKFNISADYLYTGKGPKFKSDQHLKENALQILTVVTDHENEEQIVHVPVSAQAGYGGQLHDPIFIQGLQSFTLPGFQFKNGSFRCFDISGDSMEPTLFSGDKVVCSYLEQSNWIHSIKNNYVYVIVTEHDVLIKRLFNRIKENDCIELFSDNSFYHPYPVEIEEVKEIWYVEIKISPFMPSPNNVRNALHQEFDELKRKFTDQSQLIRNLNTTIEKLLKQNRVRI